MINLDEFRSAEGEALRVFMETVHRGLMIERRSSTLVRCRVHGVSLDFRIIYVGPSRPRRQKRAARDDGSKQGA